MIFRNFRRELHSPTNLPMPGAEMLFDAPSHAETSTGANDSDDAKNQMLKRS